MPEKPTWDFIRQAADKITDKALGVYGVCLRGKPGWNENIALLTATANSFGARWYDEQWLPQFNTPEWKTTLDYYISLMKADGPPSASSNGFSENLALFTDGKCGIWIDATVAAGVVTDPKQSKVADKVGFALAPDQGLGKRANWLWAWSLAVPAGSNKVGAAEKFISWATNKQYTQLVAMKEGWAHVPPGTRTSLYNNPTYLKAAPFAKQTFESIEVQPTRFIRLRSRSRTLGCNSWTSLISRASRLKLASTSRMRLPEQSASTKRSLDRKPSLRLLCRRRGISSKLFDRLSGHVRPHSAPRRASLGGVRPLEAKRKKIPFGERQVI